MAKVFLLLFYVLSSTNALPLDQLEALKDYDASCPPWFIVERSESNCTCGNSIGGIISCHDGHTPGLEIKYCYCMTSDQLNATLLGSCSYTCPSGARWFPDKRKLNYHMCTETWNRQGRLCSQCIGGHGPPVYSYSMQCIPCSPEVVRDSIVYFLVSFLPLTV